MTTIEQVSETTRNITTENGTVIEAIISLWEDGVWTVYAEWDEDHIYQTVRAFKDPLIDGATDEPTDDDIIGAWETAIGW